MNGCEYMKCADFYNGVCNYEKDYCKFNPPNDELDRLQSENAALKAQLAELREAAKNFIASYDNQLDEDELRFIGYRDDELTETGVDRKRNLLELKRKFESSIAALRALLNQEQPFNDGPAEQGQKGD